MSVSESSRLELAGTPEAAGAGNVGLCLSLALAFATLWTLTSVAAALLLSPHWPAAAAHQSPSVPLAQCALALVATASAELVGFSPIQFGIGSTSQRLRGGSRRTANGRGCFLSRPLLVFPPVPTEHHCTPPEGTFRACSLL